VDSADVVLDAEAVEDMVEIVVKEAVLVVVAEVEAVEDLEADVDAAATTATKTVILPENAPRETVVAMEDPNTKKNGTLTRNLPINFSCLDVIKKNPKFEKIIK